MPDRLAHFPFPWEDLSALTPGSFLGGIATEDPLVAAVWRLRRWNLYGYIERLPTGDDPVVELNDPTGPGYIFNGENNFSGEESDPFDSSPDDIMEHWRKTRSYSGATVGGPAGIDIFWGPRGNYASDGNPAIAGVLDSEILFTASDGDTEFFLGTQEGRVVGGPDGGILDTPSSVDFQFTDCAGTTTTITLWYPHTSDTPAIEDWQGNLYLKPGDLWWPWPIDGDDTWDVATGEALQDPFRNDTNGHPFRVMCRQA